MPIIIAENDQPKWLGEEPASEQELLPSFDNLKSQGPRPYHAAFAAWPRRPGDCPPRSAGMPHAVGRPRADSSTLSGSDLLKSEIA